MAKESAKTLHNSLQKAQQWLRDIMNEFGWDDEQKAYTLLRAVLHALRDRLTVELNAHVSAQLPLVVRGLYFEGWNPSVTPLRLRTLDDFLDVVCEGASDTKILQDEVEAMTRKALKVIAGHLSPGLVENIKSAMPKPLQQLWEPH